MIKRLRKLFLTTTFTSLTTSSLFGLSWKENNDVVLTKQEVRKSLTTIEGSNTIYNNNVIYDRENINKENAVDFLLNPYDF